MVYNDPEDLLDLLGIDDTEIDATKIGVFQDAACYKILSKRASPNANGAKAVERELVQIMYNNAVMIQSYRENPITPPRLQSEDITEAMLSELDGPKTGWEKITVISNSLED